MCPAMEHRDYGLKRSLSIGIKFSSPSCCHPVPSLLLSSPSRHHPVCVLQWNIASPSHLPLVTIPCMCPAMEHRDCGLKRSFVYWHKVILSLSLSSPSCLLSSSPSRHYPLSSPLVSLLSPSCVCPAMEHRDCGLKRSLSIGIKFSPSLLPLVTIPSPLFSLSSPSSLLSFSSPSRHHPMHVSCNGT